MSQDLDLKISTQNGRCGQRENIGKKENKLQLRALSIVDNNKNVMLRGRLCHVAWTLFDINGVLQGENTVLEERQQYVNYRVILNYEDVF